MPSQPEAQGDILKEFREGTFLSSLDRRQVGELIWRRIACMLGLPQYGTNAASRRV